MSSFRSRSDSAPAASSEKGPTVVFETDGRILYEIDSASLAKRPLVIGRDKACDWCTAGIDNSVSSRHAELLRRRGSVWIRDLGSRNGLYVRGERVKEHRLTTDEPVLVGACKITLEPARAAKESVGSVFHRLEQRNGPESGRVFELKGDADLVIGSDPGSDIFVPDTLVSRQHAKLSFKKDGSCWVSDLGSRNGTAVDGMAVANGKERLLRDGNVLSVAYIEFKFLDKNAAHVNAHVGAKLLVAAATIAFGVMGYSLWNLARHDAGWYLALARAESERWSPKSDSADFAQAFAYLDQAAVARQADAYRSNIAETRSEMEAWTNTIAGWKSVRDDLEEGYFVSAQESFHLLSSWTWNADSATRALQQAGAVQRLVNAFLSARVQLRRTDWEPGEEKATFLRMESTLSNALGAEGLLDTDSEENAYLIPLVGEAKALRDEFHDTLGRLSEIPDLLAGLQPKDGSDPASDAARSALRRLVEMKRLDGEHARDRIAEIGSEKCPFRANPDFPFFAPIVATRISEAQKPLEILSDAEIQFQRNVSAIASGSWETIRNPLDVSSREQADLTDLRPECMRYRKWLVARNESLCGTPGRMDGIRGGFESRLSAMRKHGFGPFLSSTPSVFGSLRNPEFLPAVLSFVDAKTPFSRVDATNSVCAYDKFAGIAELGAFVVSVSSGASVDEAAKDYKAAWSERKWKSELQQLRDGLELVRSFRRWCETDRTGLVRLVLEDRPSFGDNRCARALEAADVITNDVAVWCSRDLAGACKNEETERAAIFADAVTLLLANPETLRKGAEADRAADMVFRWKKLQERLKQINRRAELDPVGAWTEIVAHGFPANVAPFKAAWRNLCEREGLK